MSDALVAIGYCMPDKVSSYFHTSLVQLIRAEAHRVGPTIGVISGPKIDDARNKIVHAFLEETEATHLLMVDTDQVLRRDTISRLLEADKDIVGGLIFIGASGVSPIRPNVVVSVPVGEGPEWTMEPLWEYPTDTVVQVAGVGAACMMVTREVYEKVLVARGDQHPLPWFAHGMHKGIQIGEDIAFCLTAQKIGFEVWCDTGLVIPHVKPRFIDEATYVISLNTEAHPYYNDREKVPVYQEFVGHGDSSLDSD